MDTNNGISEGVTNLLLNVAGIQPSENLLILSQNEVRESITDRFAEVARNLGAEPATIRCEAPLYGNDLPRMLATALIGSDVVIDLFNVHTAFSNTKAAWRAIFEYGVRMLHVDPPHNAVLKSKAVSIHPEIICMIAHKLMEKVAHGKTIHVFTDSGTQFTYEFDIRKTNAQRKFPLNFGSSPVPIGVFTLPPVRGTCNGTVVVDAVDGFPGPLQTPTSFEIKESLIEEVKGGMEAAYFKEAFAKYKMANYLSEFGIGINPFVPLKSLIKERWHESINRTAGLVHTGVGGTYWEGGSKSFHSHQVILEPTVEIGENDEIIIEKGSLKVLEEDEIKKTLEGVT